MAFWRLYYHLVWATKERQPLIPPKQEALLYDYIIGKADTCGCIVHAIGGIEDHVHLVVSIPPHISIADFVKSMKGSSSYFMNSHVLSPISAKFAWQEGYGVFSLDSKQLERVVAYVQNQKTHHAQKTAIAALERLSHQNEPPDRWHQT
jgi:putative transposase